MTLRLNGSTSGYVEIDAPATAGSNTLVLPTGNGTNGQYLQTNGSGGLSWATLPAGGYTFLAAGTVSGNTSVTVTGIPTTAQQIIIPFRSMSNNDANPRKIKLNVGSGSVDTGSNYTYSVGAESTGYNSTNGATYYLVTPTPFSSGANVFDGMIWVTRIGTNEWAVASLIGETVNNNPPSYGAGRYSGANTIDRVQLSCDTGTFDSGEFRVGYI